MASDKKTRYFTDWVRNFFMTGSVYSVNLKCKNKVAGMRSLTAAY
jgi:hypothetical protein